MLQLCGDNEYTQLGISSNDKNIKWHPIVSPPANLHLDISSLLSNSVYSNHSVWITHHCKAHAIGLNHGCRICSSSKEKFKKETQFSQDTLCSLWGALFCIAGAAKSAVFINCEPPPHCSNKRLLRAKDQEILEMSHCIDHLQRKLAKEHSDNKKNLTKIKKLEKDLEEARKDKLEILKPSQIAQYSKVKRIGHSQNTEVYQVNREEIFALKIIDTKSFRKEEADKQTEE